MSALALQFEQFVTRGVAATRVVADVIGIAARIALLERPIKLDWHLPSSHEAMRRSSWSREREDSWAGYRVWIGPVGSGWGWRLERHGVVVRRGHRQLRLWARAAVVRALKRAVDAELGQLRERLREAA